jgi:hypothetical protein
MSRTFKRQYYTDPEVEEAFMDMGRTNENLFRPILETYFNAPLKRYNDNFAVLDFYSYKFRVELKSRTNSVNEYDTTYIGNNKVVKAFEKLKEKRKTNPNYKCWFAFAFPEGLYLWEVNEENYEKNGGDNAIEYKGTKNRGFADYKDHLLIKVENLIKIDNTPCYINPKCLEVKTNPVRKTAFPEGVCLLKLPKN